MNLSEGEPFAVRMYLFAVGLQCFSILFSKDGFMVDSGRYEPSQEEKTASPEG